MTLRTFTLETASEMPCSAEELWRWHARPGAFERLTPPWMSVDVENVSIPGEDEEPGGSPVTEGGRLELRMGRPLFGLPPDGPVPVPRLRWVAEHFDVRPGESFKDRQVEGPFAHWVHEHRFEAITAERSRLVDRVEWAPPLGALGRLAAAGSIRDDLERSFAYRHRLLAEDLKRHAETTEDRWTVAVSGASGLVGSALVALLESAGHRVLRLVRRDPSKLDPNGPEVAWLPDRGLPEPERLTGIDAVVHLAGENIAGGRWTESRRRRIRESRGPATRRLIASLAELERPPRLFLCASAVGWYGAETAGVREGAAVTEKQPAGEGFLAEVCREWEAAALEAEEVCERVAIARFGVVLTPAGGALAKMLPAFLFGGGGPLGSGRQQMSWIGLDDVVYGLHLLLSRSDLEGPFNFTAPESVAQKDFAKTLGRVLHRPSFLPLPRFALETLFGEMAEETLLADQRVAPQRLLEAGYRHAYPDLEPALRHLLGKM